MSIFGATSLTAEWKRFSDKNIPGEWTDDTVVRPYELPVCGFVARVYPVPSDKFENGAIKVIESIPEAGERVSGYRVLHAAAVPDGSYNFILKVNGTLVLAPLTTGIEIGARHSILPDSWDDSIDAAGEILFSNGNIMYNTVSYTFTDGAKTKNVVTNELCSIMGRHVNLQMDHSISAFNIPDVTEASVKLFEHARNRITLTIPDTAFSRTGDEAVAIIKTALLPQYGSRFSWLLPGGWSMVMSKELHQKVVKNYRFFTQHVECSYKPAVIVDLVIRSIRLAQRLSTLSDEEFDDVIFLGYEDFFDHELVAEQMPEIALALRSRIVRPNADDALFRTRGNPYKFVIRALELGE